MKFLVGRFCFDEYCCGLFQGSEDEEKWKRWDKSAFIYDGVECGGSSDIIKSKR